jgi:gliding motility-associated-like protein
VESVDSFLNYLTLTACQGTSVEYDNQSLAPGGPYVFPYTAQNGCDSTWIVQVNEADSVLQNVQITICDNETTDWNGQTLLPDSTYAFVFSAQNGCDSTVLVQVVGQPAPFVVLPADTLLQLGQTIDLTPAVSGVTPFTYAWQPPGLLSCNTCPDPVALPLSDTWFSVTVTDGVGCRATDSVLVRIDPDCGLYVPNVFRPDDDGYNDRFYPFAGDCIREVLYLRVYDRWGELVFERKNFAPNQENMGWDGAFRGDPAMPGVYVWVAEFEYVDGRKSVVKGDVTIVN